jgi:hypothetical protein
MTDSKLIQVLKTLSADEFGSLEKFIKNPLSKSRDVTGLYRLLKPHHPDFKSSALEKEKVFKKLYPHQNYSGKKIKNLTHDLLRLTEEFLIYNYIRNNRTESLRVLSLEYRKRKSYGLFYGTLTKLERDTLLARTKESFDSVDCFKDLEDIELNKGFYYNIKGDFGGMVNSRINYTEYLILSFLIKLFRRLRERRIAATAYNLPMQHPLIDAFIESIDFEKMINALEERQYERTWLLKIFYNCFKSFDKADDDAYYREFKRLFFENIEYFNRIERYFIFSDFAAYCVEKDRTGNPDYGSEELEVYRQMLMHDAYASSEDEFLPLLLYRNIIILCLKLKEYEWLSWFGENYTDKLNPEYRFSMKALLDANVCFAQRKFETALEHLSRVEYDVFVYKLDVKNLMLRIFYELELYEQAFSLIDAYRHYLSSTAEVSDLTKKGHHDFLSFYSKILKAKSSDNFDGMPFLESQLHKHPMFPSRQWLLEKAKELTEKRNPSDKPVRWA